MADQYGEILETVMGLIMHGGDAKSSAMEAIHAAKNGDFEEALNRIDAAEEALNKAHEYQTSLLTKEANEDSLEITLLMVHGQDHLMNAITVKDLAIEVIDVYRKIDGQDVSTD